MLVMAFHRRSEQPPMAVLGAVYVLFKKQKKGPLEDWEKNIKSA